MECLRAISKLLDAPLPEKVYMDMLPIILPLIDLVFHPESGDFFEEGLSMLNIILFKLRNQKALPQSIWFYFPALCYILGGAP